MLHRRCSVRRRLDRSLSILSINAYGLINDIAGGFAKIAGMGHMILLIRIYYFIFHSSPRFGMRVHIFLNLFQDLTAYYAFVDSETIVVTL